MHFTAAQSAVLRISFVGFCECTAREQRLVELLDGSVYAVVRSRDGFPSVTFSVSSSIMWLTDYCPEARMNPNKLRLEYMSFAGTQNV